MWAFRAAVTSLFFLSSFFTTSGAFHLRIGVPASDCGSGDIASGLQFFATALASRREAALLAIVDAEFSYPVNYSAVAAEAHCSADALASSLRRVAASCQFLLGGVGYPEAQSYAANALQRVLVHAAVTSDGVHDLGLPYVYGITTSPASYAVPALRAMVLSGLTRVAVAWRTDAHDATLPAACAGAAAQAPLLAQLRPGVSLLNFTYTSADVAAAAAAAAASAGGGGGGAGFFPRLVAKLSASGAQALVACDDANSTAQLAAAVEAAGSHLSGLWLAGGSAASDVAEAAGLSNVLTAAQWSAAAQYGDALFGPAAAYAAAFAAATGRPASDDAAGASAAALTLALAVSRAFTRCNISAEVAAAGDTWRLLFDPSALSCEDGAAGGSAAAVAAGGWEGLLGVMGGSSGSGISGTGTSGGSGNVTGYSLIMRALLEGRFETFYGPVAFNALRRNVGRPAPTTQLQPGGGAAVVMPPEAAGARLVMPAPLHYHKHLPLHPGVIVGIVCGSLLLLAAAALVAVYRRQRRRNRNLFGQIRAPGVSPLTTLLITDIESSTTLWEALPPSVMERAMELHDGILRGLAAEHDGYESANEGDSFVLAFHNPMEAVMFAVKAQQRLLLAPWPEALLRHERAEVVWMALTPDASLLSAACATSSWCAELTSTLASKAITQHQAGGGGGGGGLGGLGGLAGLSGLGLGGLGSLSVRAQYLQRNLTDAARGTLRRLASYTLAGGQGAVAAAAALARPSAGVAGAGGGGANGHAAAAVWAGPGGGAAPTPEGMGLPQAPHVTTGEQAGFPDSGEYGFGSVLSGAVGSGALAVPGSGPLSVQRRPPGGQAPSPLQAVSLPPSAAAAAAAPTPMGRARKLLFRSKTGGDALRAPHSPAPSSVPEPPPRQPASLSQGPSLALRVNDPGPVAEATSYDADGGGAGGDLDASGVYSPFSAAAAAVAVADVGSAPTLRPTSAPAAAGRPLPPLLPPHLQGPSASAGVAGSAVTAATAHGGAVSRQLTGTALAGLPPPPLAAATAAGGSGEAAGPSGRSSFPYVAGALAHWRDAVSRARASIGSVSGLGGVGGGGMELAALPSGTSSGTPTMRPTLTAAGLLGGGSGGAGGAGGGPMSADYAPESSLALNGAAGGSGDGGAGGGGGGAGMMRNAVLGKLISSIFCRARPGDSTRLLAQRGLRVRMGLHSGLTDPHALSTNKASGRAQYGGPFLAVTKRTSDVAHGGQVVLTEDAYRQLPARCLTHRAWLLHAGQHLLADPASPACALAGGEEEEAECEFQLYEVVPYELGVRLALLPPLRSPAQLLSGVLGAPAGGLTICFMYVHALAALMSWSSELAGEAVELFHRVAAHSCREYGGYVSESAEGLVLAAFRDPGAALLWALGAQQALLQAPWDPELLEHELAEEVTVLVPDTGLGAGADAGAGSGEHSHPAAAADGGGGGAQPLPRLEPPPNGVAAAANLSAYGVYGGGGDDEVPPGMVRKVLLRGLRMRVGIDVGRLTESLSPVSSTMIYRGKAMNRAARIGMLASASQILCSAAAWSTAASGPVAAEVRRRIGAVSLGRHVLRGVSEPIEVFHCRLRAPADTPGAPDGSVRGAVAAALAAADGAGMGIGGGGDPNWSWSGAFPPLPGSAAAAAATARRAFPWGSLRGGGVAPRPSLQRRFPLSQSQQQQQQRHAQQPHSEPLAPVQVPTLPAAAATVETSQAVAASAPLPPSLMVSAADVDVGAADGGERLTAPKAGLRTLPAFALAGRSRHSSTGTDGAAAAPAAGIANAGAANTSGVQAFGFAAAAVPSGSVASGDPWNGRGKVNGGAVQADAGSAGAGPAATLPMLSNMFRHSYNNSAIYGLVQSQTTRTEVAVPPPSYAAPPPPLLPPPLLPSPGGTSDAMPSDGGGSVRILSPVHGRAAGRAASLASPGLGMFHSTAGSIAAGGGGGDAISAGGDGDGDDAFALATGGSVHLHMAAILTHASTSAAHQHLSGPNVSRHSNTSVPRELETAVSTGGGLRASRTRRLGSVGSCATLACPGDGTLSGSVLAAVAAAAASGHRRRTGGSVSTSGSRSVASAAAPPLRERLTAAAASLLAVARGSSRTRMQLHAATGTAAPAPAAARPPSSRTRRRSVLTPRAAAALDPAVIHRSLLSSIGGSSMGRGGRGSGRRSSVDSQRALNAPSIELDASGMCLPSNVTPRSSRPARHSPAAAASAAASAAFAAVAAALPARLTHGLSLPSPFPGVGAADDDDEYGILQKHLHTEGEGKGKGEGDGAHLPRFPTYTSSTGGCATFERHSAAAAAAATASSCVSRVRETAGHEVPRDL